MDLYKLKYPIGEFVAPTEISAEHIEKWIQELEKFPKELTSITQSLDSEALNWRYRPNGWTIKQVVHHCADSHLNCTMRFKLALTEDLPTIRPYDETLWSKLPDSQTDDIADSIAIIQGIHGRLVTLLKSLGMAELDREFHHPEHGKQFSVKETIGNYAWHSNHHLAHVKQALIAKGRF